jgi:hypothetical protein
MLDPVADGVGEKMGPLVEQIGVDGALLDPGSRRHCWDNVIEGYVDGLQREAVKKGHEDSSQRERSEGVGFSASPYHALASLHPREAA